MVTGPRYRACRSLRCPRVGHHNGEPFTSSHPEYAQSAVRRHFTVFVKPLLIVVDGNAAFIVFEKGNLGAFEGHCGNHAMNPRRG